MFFANWVYRTRGAALRLPEARSARFGSCVQQLTRFKLGRWVAFREPLEECVTHGDLLLEPGQHPYTVGTQGRRTESKGSIRTYDEGEVT